MDIRSDDFDLQSEVESLLRRDEECATGRSSADAIDDLQRLDRCLARLEAMRTELLVEAADPLPRVEEFTVESADGQIRHRPRMVRIEDAVREEIAAALRWSPNHAGSLIAEARQLHTYLPATRSALRGGAISGRHASVVAEWSRRLSGGGGRRDQVGQLGVLGDSGQENLENQESQEGQASQDDGPNIDDAYAQLCAAFEERVLRVARRGTVAQTRAAAKRAVAALDSAGAKRRRQQQRCMRDVTIVDESDGNSLLLARLATPAARAVLEAVGHEAALIETASLTAGERRAQALTALVLGAPAPEVRLNVVVPATGVLAGDMADTSSLARLVDSMFDGLEHATIDRAEVDSEDLRDLLADRAVGVTMRKLVADPITGVLSGCGRGSYRVPERLREFIVRRDVTCRFPGCGRSASKAQIDHAHPWDDGGATDSDNLGALCTRHHQLKTHGGWQLQDSRSDGACTWISPGGRRYRRQPESIIEVTLQQQFARVLAGALSTEDDTGYPGGPAPAQPVADSPGHPPAQADADSPEHPPTQPVAQSPPYSLGQASRNLRKHSTLRGPTLDFTPPSTLGPQKRSTIRKAPEAPEAPEARRREPDPPF